MRCDTDRWKGAVVCGTATTARREAERHGKRLECPAGCRRSCNRFARLTPDEFWPKCEGRPNAVDVSRDCTHAAAH